MDHYENLLNNKKSKLNNKNEINNNPFKDDDFFKYIFENIQLNKKKEEKEEKEIFSENISKDQNESSNFFYNDLVEDNNWNQNQNQNQNIFIEEKLDEEWEINHFIKKIYKKIIIKCHPDKNGNPELFLKCQEYYENHFLIGILYIGYKIQFQLPSLNEIIIKRILNEIRIIEEKIIDLEDNCTKL